jgi:hypothetical protein
LKSRAGRPANKANDRGELIQIAAPDTPSNAAKEEDAMRSLIQSTPAYELSADIATSRFGYSLRLISFIPTARRPEEHLQFQAILSTTELRALRALLDQALQAASD